MGHIDKVRIANTALDNRVKLTDDQKLQLRKYWNDFPETSYKELGDLFSCSKSEAYYVCNPGKYKNMLAQISKRQEFDTAKQTTSKSNTRQKKRDFLTQNKKNGKSNTNTNAVVVIKGSNEFP